MYSLRVLLNSRSLAFFSELNNIKNISMNEPYAAVCGISCKEICTQMREDITVLVEKRRIRF